MPDVFDIWCAWKCKNVSIGAKHLSHSMTAIVIVGLNRLEWT